jgi:hypothetical protein
LQKQLKKLSYHLKEKNMEPTEQAVIEALMLSHRDPELEKEDARQLFRRAQAMLEHGEVLFRYMIVWGSDDDTSSSNRTLISHYESEAGECELVLTDFFQPPPYNREHGMISLEVHPAGSVRVRDGHFDGVDGQTLFSIDSNGELFSPLDLVDVSIANSFLDACAESQAAKWGSSKNLT